MNTITCFKDALDCLALKCNYSLVWLVCFRNGRWSSSPRCAHSQSSSGPTSSTSLGS